MKGIAFVAIDNDPRKCPKYTNCRELTGPSTRGVYIITRENKNKSNKNNQVHLRFENKKYHSILYSMIHTIFVKEIQQTK